ncbi:hypothetical protein PENTCL1PPCAC_4195 [Pristionchus entomophagus]|uniref:aralkylamine N-acetyltransferase n=1 Tax=Pristionchus entomophagus TaxID=358040 RepID=A0AAV5SPJ7_9BILA|nr:hypothetical protein PENTCL1PPCAC_4195 [Pristionchus entomophagus]
MLRNVFKSACRRTVMNGRAYKPRIDAVTTSFATLNDVDEMHEFLLRDYLHNTSLNAAINLTREEAAPRYRATVEHCVPFGTSTVLRNSENSIIGICLTFLLHRGQGDDSQSPTTVQTIQDLGKVLNKNKWELIPADVSTVVYADIGSVDERYRGHGLLEKQFHLIYEEAQKAGATAFMAEGTSFASQRVFAKQGFTVLREVQHQDILGADGKPVFECPDGTRSAQLVFRRLEPRRTDMLYSNEL